MFTVDSGYRISEYDIKQTFICMVGCWILAVIVQHTLIIRLHWAFAIRYKFVFMWLFNCRKWTLIWLVAILTSSWPISASW